MPQRNRNLKCRRSGEFCQAEKNDWGRAQCLQIHKETLVTVKREFFFQDFLLNTDYDDTGNGRRY